LPELGYRELDEDSYSLDTEMNKDCQSLDTERWNKILTVGYRDE
jgi:hypothetical protein